MPIIHSTWEKLTSFPRLVSSPASEIVEIDTGRSAPVDRPPRIAPTRRSGKPPATTLQAIATAMPIIVTLNTGLRPKRSPSRPPTPAPMAMPRVSAKASTPIWSPVSPRGFWYITRALPEETMVAASR